MTANKTKWVRLGDYIERSMANNKDLTYGVDLIQGVNSDGTFSSSKANTIDINLKPYKIVLNGDFVYNPSRLNIGSIAYRQEGLCIVSHLYVVFRLNERGRQCIIPEFLYLYFRRDEFFRQITFLNFGSQRPEFNFFEMSDIRIPLPSMEVQRELVATYEGLKRLAEDNEALIAPLTEACQAFIVDCKRQYPSVPLGDYIEEVDERNTKRTYSEKDCVGVNIDKELKLMRGNLESKKFELFKLVEPFAFVYNPRGSRKLGLGFNGRNMTYITTFNNITFRVNKDNLSSEYLYLLLSRKEFDRNAEFRSWGSSTEVFSWSALCETIIPLPPLEVQQSIVNLYHCIEEAKSIAREAREMLTTLCPALIRYAIDA